MSADPHVIERLVSEARQLDTQDRVLLIHRLLETLTIPSQPSSDAGFLRFGEFSGERMSNEDDFAMAEWRPSEHDLNAC